ncbi:putative AAA ATPase [Skeletonema marinoi]|uniref:AAA ATPase n=1 Tax=Skeletonema marinoi TaxID=267567 RepID=A0AAD8Y2J6_9STRA|nr:putative AAA ATPase [Skeletonema marinoi]
MSGSTISVSLQDLLNSGALATSTFQLKNEESTTFNIAASNSSQMQMLSAAKISLLLARAFAKHKVGAHSSIDASSLQLGDFSIHLGYSLPPSPDGVSATTENLNEPLISSDDSDASLQFISEFFDLDKPLPQFTGQQQQQSLQNTTTAFNGQMQINTTTGTRKPAPTLTFRDVLSAEGFDRVWTLISIDCNPSTNRYVSTTTPPEHTLGDLIHCIFSGSNLRLSSTIIQRPADNIDSISEGRAAKMNSNTRGTTFSTLVGVGILPTSICRLLSDFLQCEPSIGSEDRLHTCQISFQDAIEDLEHMCAYPQIYLYDPGMDFYSKNLLFGQRLYGRKAELTQLLGITTRLEGGLISSGAECVLVSGGAGSGKSHFVNNVSTFLSNIGWIVSTASCGRDMGHRSSETVLSLLDTLIVNIVAAYNSEGKSAIDALLGVLDSTTLLSLSAYLPSLRIVSGNTDISTPPNNRPEVSQLQLTFLLPRLLIAILSLNRKVVLFLDNFEHVDSSALALLSELLTSVGRLPSGRSNFLFIGCYRDGISEQHPLTVHLADFRRHQDISLTEMSLNRLSIDDVTDIIMTELRLPRRLVLELANIVHKKTSGHALFVVQLLNSLVRDSVLAYSPMKRRFDWDSAKVRSLKTADSVASLIVSNLNSLTPGELPSLRALSCFGIQVKLVVLALLKDGCPFGGVEPYLKSLIEGGVVEMKDSLVVFTHDLIQQGVYNNIPTEERRRLHLNIGVCLGMKVSLDQHYMMGQLEMIDFSSLSFEASRNVESQEINAIIGIAANQVNRVDPSSMERSQRIRFAGWNMVAASQFAKRFNFGASAHYCKKGIDLLYDSLWCNETFDLSRALHEGAASALLFLGDISDAQKYANVVIDNLPFADSLAAQYMVLRSWERMGKYEEQVDRGSAILRGLNFDIPLEPSPLLIMDAMAHISNIASKYSIEQIAKLRSGKVDTRKKNILLSLNSIITGALRSSSPFLPLITCAVVNYSLQNGVYEESALSFACLGYFKIALAGDYKEARYWADATKQILNKSVTSIAGSRARIFLYGFVECWYVSLRETGSHLLGINRSAVAMGDVESAVHSMLFSLRCSFYGSENLSLLLQSHCELMRTMKRYKELAKLALIDVVMIETLIGTKSNAFDIFEGTIPTENFILADAKAKQNIVSIELIHTRRFFTAFWFGDYQKANESYKAASSVPSSKMPKLWTIYRECYKAIITFHMYAEGEGEEWLQEGMKLLSKFQFWKTISKDVIESKFLLLQAEYHAVSCEISKARASFEASIKSARDHGFTNEQGLAFERYGTFLEALVETTEASVCYKSAHVCYLQWGALALAEHVWKKYKLSTCNEGVHPLLISAAVAKHARS